MTVKDFIATALGRGDYVCEWFAASSRMEECFPARLLQRLEASTKDSSKTS